jgi:hypothetical protein
MRLPDCFHAGTRRGPRVAPLETQSLCDRAAGQFGPFACTTGVEQRLSGRSGDVMDHELAIGLASGLPRGKGLVPLIALLLGAGAQARNNVLAWLAQLVWQDSAPCSSAPLLAVGSP